MMPMGYLRVSRIYRGMSRVKTKLPPKKNGNFQVVMLPYNYETPNLKEVVREIQHLDKEQKDVLVKTLTDNKAAFQGMKGH